ncbi:hypothetical protein FQN51_001919 [Onygenales sp. PD_10]|nr:hypothetical protein FQN51_001919 [Onygenales sp. PD_10]
MAGVASMSVSWGPRIISRSSHLGRNMLMFVNVARATPAGSQTAFESKRNYHSTRSCCSFRGGNKHTAMENIPTWQPTSRNFSAISSKCIARSQTLAFKARASQQRFLSTNSPGKGNDDKGQNKNEPASKTARLLSRLPLPVHENIYTIPNILTFSRLAAAPVIGYCILNGYDTAALSLFAYASITDLVDGYIARKFNQQTVVGTVIDPMADKTLMTIGVVCLALKYIVAGTTFWSGASYVYSKDAVKILTAEEIERRAALKREPIEGKKDGEN